MPARLHRRAHLPRAGGPVRVGLQKDWMHMVKVTARTQFDMVSELSLSTIAVFGTGFASPFTGADVLFGTKYASTAAYQFQLGENHLAVFGGTGFKFDTNHLPTAGTVSALALTDGAISDGGSGQNVLVTIVGMKVAAAALGAALASPDQTDDFALISSIFSGDDTFVLSSSDDVAYGLGGNDTIKGGLGSDTLFGGSGNDRLFGEGGNDVLQGDSGTNLISGGSGYDFASYVQATGPQVINLNTQGADKVQKNGDTLIGVEGIFGSQYGDTLTASDTLHGTVDGATRFGTLFGESGNDTLIGGAGADRLSGGFGNDVLTGNGGKDQFFFDVAPSSLSADTITDFTHLQDSIALSQFAYRGLATSGGHLLATEFYASSRATVAHDADDRFVYNTSTGKLYYDADGAGGIGAQLVATLGTDTHPHISAYDIIVV